MKRRNFGKGFFDDEFFEGFERIEEMMREMLESHFAGFDERKLKEFDNARPRVYGFTLEFGPQGKGRMTEFGTGGVQQPGMQKQRQKHGEPFIDVMNHPDRITLIAELPGVEEKHLHLKAFPKQLTLRVSDPQRFFTKTLALPAEVDENSLKSTLKNGILEIVLKKKK